MKIIHVTDVLNNNVEISEWENLSEFIRSTFSDKSDILNLRFFHPDILGDELDTSNPDFLNKKYDQLTVISEDAIPKAPAIPYIVTTIVFALVTIALIPKVNVASNVEADRNQTSSTNSALGSRKNKARLNERIDDIFGTVNFHSPSLIQQPYRQYENNSEVERFLTLVGRGKYQINSMPRDGDTPFNRLSGGKVNIYEPGQNPNTARTPYYSVGGQIDDLIRDYRLISELQSQELQPENAPGLLSTEVSFTPFQAPDIPELPGYNVYDLTVEYIGDDENYVWTNDFQIGDKIRLRDFWYLLSFARDQNLQITRVNDSDAPYNTSTLTIYRIFSLPEYQYYIVSDISGTTLTLDTTLLNSNYRNQIGEIPPGYTQPDTEKLWWIEPDTINDGATKPVVFNRDMTSNDWLVTEESGDKVNAYTRQFDRDNVAIGSFENNDIGPFSGKYSEYKYFYINLVARNGFYDQKNTVTIKLTVDIEVLIEETDSGGVLTGNQDVNIIQFTSNKDAPKKQSAQTYHFTIPPTYEYYQISLRRITDRNIQSSITNVDKVSIEAMYFYNDPIDVSNFGDVTIGFVEIPYSSTATSVKERLFNLDITRKITPYDPVNGFGETESLATDDFSQILIHACMDDKIGGLNVEQFNIDGIYSLSQEMSNYYGDGRMIKFGYDFDSTDITFQETFTLICDSVNCTPFVQNSIYDVFFEKLQTESSMQITHRNKISDSETVKENFTRQNDGIEITYRSENSGVNEIITYPEDAIKPVQIELPGCTTEIQAFRRVKREYNKLLYKHKTVTFETDGFGRMIIPGQRIDSPDSTRYTLRDNYEGEYKVYDGEVVSVSGLTIELSQPVKFTPGENHYITFTREDGYSSEPILCSETSDEFSVLLSEAPLESIYSGYMMDKTKFIFMSDQISDSVALLPITIDFNYNDGKETNSITSVNYDPRYYQSDLEEL